MEEAIKRGILAPRSESALQTLNITVLSGGPSAEREVSLASGQAVCNGLLQKGHTVSLRDISPENISALNARSDFIFIALHGTFGEDGQIQKLLEERRIPFCGSGSGASALAMDKTATKAQLRRFELPTPAFEIVRQENIASAAKRWRTPSIVKPVASGSSVDVHIVHNSGELRQSLEYLVRSYGQAMVEEYIRGPELAVSILGDSPLPVIQIRTKREFYDYQAKYVDNDTEYLFDIGLPSTLIRKIQVMSLKAMEALGCRDFCRVDWIVDEITHEPWIIELNTIPGFTSHSLLPKAAARLGISFDDLCQRIVELGVKRYE